MLSQQNVMLTQLMAAVKPLLRDTGDDIEDAFVDAGNDIKDVAEDVGDILWDKKPDPLNDEKKN
jgi:hypothetical protein